MKLFATAALLTAVLSWADWRSVASVLGDLDVGWLIVAAVLFGPQTLLSAVRWQYLCGDTVTLSTGESLRQTLSRPRRRISSCPASWGTPSNQRYSPALTDAPLRVRVGLVIVERGFDVAALLMLWMLGVTVAQLGSSGAVACAIVPACVVLVGAGVWLRTPLKNVVSTKRFIGTAGMSLLLWMLHLGQIQAFILAAGVDASMLTAVARVPAAIFAGLMPVSLWGVGARDATLIALYADSASAGAMAAVGLLTASRYLMPGLAGVPCLWGYLSREGDSLRDTRPGRSGTASATAASGSR